MIWSSMGWDTEGDFFALSLASPIETNNGYPITRRSILAATNQLHDPLSILTPVIILGNIIFRSVLSERWAKTILLKNSFMSSGSNILKI